MVQISNGMNKLYCLLYFLLVHYDKQASLQNLFSSCSLIVYVELQTVNECV